MRVVCTIIGYFDPVDHRLSMIGDIEHDNDHFLLEKHNSMIVIHVFAIDLVLELDNRLLYVDDEYRQ